MITTLLVFLGQKSNNMKVFGCKSQYYCSDGIILVAANTIHEAYNLATKDERLEMSSLEREVNNGYT